MSSFRMIFKDLKSHIAHAIKESSTKTDARIYNIANEVQNVVSPVKVDGYSLEPLGDSMQELTSIIDRVVKDSIDLGCDLSIIVKGLLIGAFRSKPFISAEAHKAIEIIISEILQCVFKYKGDVKQSMDGLITAAFIIAMEFGLNVHRVLAVAEEDILNSAKAIDPKFADDVKKALPNLNNT